LITRSAASTAAALPIIAEREPAGAAAEHELVRVACSRRTFSNGDAEAPGAAPAANGAACPWP